MTALRQRSVTDHVEAWREAIEGIATSPKYGGLKITPQLGLVPLGPDPDSGLHEFAHVGSGSILKRDEVTRHLDYLDDAAIVLVLIPAGTFHMGAQAQDPNGPNYDPEATPDESPVHSVTLSPYFLAKHECTQAQWKAMTQGLDPSSYKAGGMVGRKPQTLRNPVEQVSWEDCTRWLGRNRLVLPTEAQWEYACRAGTDTPWITGRDVAALATVANTADAWLKEHGGQSFTVPAGVYDGHSVHAPVGSFRANAFGLYDMHGNVSEWCRDVLGSYAPVALTDPEGRGSGPLVIRGGSWSAVAADARSANRYWDGSGLMYGHLGVRPARPVLP